MHLPFLYTGAPRLQLIISTLVEITAQIKIWAHNIIHMRLVLKKPLQEIEIESALEQNV